jgi:HEAT repeat protein
MMKSADPWQRAGSAALVAGTEPETMLDKLTPALSDESVLVRYKAATALLKRDKGGGSIVSRAMRSERSLWLRGVVADLIAHPPQ